MKIKRIGWIICLAISSQWVYAADNSDDIIAKMGTFEIKRGEMKKIAETQGIALKGNKQAKQALEQLARAELIRRAVLVEAKKAQWEKKSEVQQQIERAKEQVLVTSFMNHTARAPTSYPAEQELKLAYETNKSMFVAPTQYRVAQIYLPNDKDAAKAERLAEELTLKAREKGADFADLARKHSAHPESAPNGGDMGWLPEDQLLPELRPALRNLQAGEIAQPVKSASGWHVLKMLERKESSQRSFAEVKDSLTQIMRLRLAEQNEREYINKLITQSPVTMNEIALTKMIE